MGFEIEHKYLVTSDSYKEISVCKKNIMQGYILRSKERTVRIRIEDNSAFITIKGQTIIDTRIEFEYNIPIADAEKLIKLCDGRIIKKTRYVVPFNGHIWEVDEFHDELEGLVIAEIELVSSSQKYDLPPFVGDNVTDNPRYYNSNL